MERETKEPAVERQYEDPPPKEQAAWNLGIYTVVAVVAALFVIAIVAFYFLR